MRHIAQSILCLGIICLAGSACAAVEPAEAGGHVLQDSSVEQKSFDKGTSPTAGNRVFFIQNSGQYDPQVKYVVRGIKGSVFFTPEEVVFDFVRTQTNQIANSEKPGIPESSPRLERLVFRMHFDAGNPNVTVLGQKELPGKINYLKKSRTAWKTGISIFREILYRNLYDDIDLRFSLPQNNLRYAIHLHGSAAPGKVRLTYSGIRGLDVNDNGDLIIHTAFGDFTEPPPKVWRNNKELKVRFRVIESNRVELVKESATPGTSDKPGQSGGGT